MQLNTARSTAADIQNAQIIRTRHTYTRAGRRLKRESYLVIQRSRALPPSRRRVHAQTYFSSTACYPAFAPGGVPVVNSHVRLMHLHFLHFITPTHSAMSNPHRHVNPSQTCQTLTDMSNPHRHVKPSQTCQSLTDTAGTTMLHQQVSKCTVSPGQSESCCRVSSALNSAISRPLPRTSRTSSTNSTQTAPKIDSHFLYCLCFF
jgi:hypothetical protein